MTDRDFAIIIFTSFFAFVGSLSGQTCGQYISRATQDQVQR